MKRFLAGAIAVGALAAASAAVASTGSLRLTQSSVTIRYGSHVVLNGVAPGGAPVSLAGSGSGKTAQAVLSTQSSATGAFHFDVAPLRRATFVASSDFGSAKIVVNVMPRLGLLRNGTVRVAPVAPFVGRTVVLQQFVNGAWMSLMSTRVNENGVAHVAKWTPGQTLRVYAPSIGHGFVAGTSRVLTADGGLILR